MLLPPPLKNSDTIGIVAPSGFIAKEKLTLCKKILEEKWHYKVVFGNTIGNDFHYFSGTDDERLEDLQNMLDDEKIKTILCARGGYGLTRIIEKINFKKFLNHPKWIIGFSDITILLNYITTKFNITTLHAAMGVSFDGNPKRTDSLQSLRKVLEGKKINYQFIHHPLNKTGQVKGILVGGNLTLLNHVIGSKFEIDLQNKILLIEDVGEYIYAIDRLIHQLERCKNFSKLAAVLVGSFTEEKDTERKFGASTYQVIENILKKYSFPYSFGIPSGHGYDNFAFKIGANYLLNITPKKTFLTEV